MWGPGNACMPLAGRPQLGGPQQPRLPSRELQGTKKPVRKAPLRCKHIFRASSCSGLRRAWHQRQDNLCLLRNICPHRVHVEVLAVDITTGEANHVDVCLAAVGRNVAKWPMILKMLFEAQARLLPMGCKSKPPAEKNVKGGETETTIKTCGRWPRPHCIVTGVRWPHWRVGTDPRQKVMDELHHVNYPWSAPHNPPRSVICGDCCATTHSMLPRRMRPMIIPNGAQQSRPRRASHCCGFGNVRHPLRWQRAPRSCHIGQHAMPQWRCSFY